MKFIIIFICIITTTVGYAIEKPDIKNLILTKNLKTYEEVIFKDNLEVIFGKRPFEKSTSEIVVDPKEDKQAPQAEQENDVATS